MIDEHQIRHDYLERLGMMCGDGYADSLHDKAARLQCKETCIENGLTEQQAINFVNKSLRGVKRNETKV